MIEDWEEPEEFKKWVASINGTDQLPSNVYKKVMYGIYLSIKENEELRCRVERLEELLGE